MFNAALRNKKLSWLGVWMTRIPEQSCAGSGGFAHGKPVLPGQGVQLIVPGLYQLKLDYKPKQATDCSEKQPIDGRFLLDLFQTPHGEVTKRFASKPETDQRKTRALGKLWTHFSTWHTRNVTEFYLSPVQPIDTSLLAFFLPEEASVCIPGFCRDSRSVQHRRMPKHLVL